MRVQSLTLAAAGAALLAPTTLPAPATPLTASAQRHPITATDLLSRVRDCAQVSKGRYPHRRRSRRHRPRVRHREGRLLGGRPRHRLRRPAHRPLQPHRRPGLIRRHRLPAVRRPPLNAETLPYIVVPVPSSRWDHRAYGIRGGAVAAVICKDRVQYAVVGDTGPRDIIGEASYATAKALGMNPGPRVGGVPSGVTYIVFKDSAVKPIEDREAAQAEGERLAALFTEGG